MTKLKCWAMVYTKVLCIGWCLTRMEVDYLLQVSIIQLVKLLFLQLLNSCIQVITAMVTIWSFMEKLSLVIRVLDLNPSRIRPMGTSTITILCNLKKCILIPLISTWCYKIAKKGKWNSRFPFYFLFSCCYIEWITKKYMIFLWFHKGKNMFFFFFFFGIVFYY